jgi:hypothetical protein
MQQLLLNITDNSKIDKLMNLLGTLNYVKVESYTEENIVVSEEEKNIIRNRVKNAKPENFKNWDDVINSFEV